MGHDSKSYPRPRLPRCTSRTSQRPRCTGSIQRRLRCSCWRGCSPTPRGMRCPARRAHLRTPARRPVRTTGTTTGLARRRCLLPTLRRCPWRCCRGGRPALRGPSSAVVRWPAEAVTQQRKRHVEASPPHILMHGSRALQLAEALYVLVSFAHASAARGGLALRQDRHGPPVPPGDCEPVDNRDDARTAFFARCRNCIGFARSPCARLLRARPQGLARSWPSALQRLLRQRRPATPSPVHMAHLCRRCRNVGWANPALLR